MKKIGRPKKFSNARNRKKMICLNEKASILLNEVEKVRLHFNFSRYISERIIDDFGNMDGFIKFLKREVGKNNKEIDLLHDKNKQIISKIKELQDQEIVREIL